MGLPDKKEEEKQKRLLQAHCAASLSWVLGFTHEETLSKLSGLCVPKDDCGCNLKRNMSYRQFISCHSSEFETRVRAMWDLPERPDE